MDERILLLLGLLKKQSQHGYQIFEFIEHVLGKVHEMKKATAYALLKKLLNDGYISAKAEQSGNRPVKQVYSITDKGEVYFFELLKKQLQSYDNITPNGEIGLMFVDFLTHEEIIHLFESKLTAIEELLAVYEMAPPHSGIGVDLSIDHRRMLLACERDWYIEAIEKVRKSDCEK